MKPTSLFLISLLATIPTAVLAADGSERAQQAREVFLLGQQAIHGDSAPETAVNGGASKAQQPDERT